MARDGFLSTQRRRSAGAVRSTAAGELRSVCGPDVSAARYLSQSSVSNRVGDLAPGRARAIVALCVLALLGWLGVGGSARAQTYPDQGAAYTACMADLAGVGDHQVERGCDQSGNYYYCVVWFLPPPNGFTRSCGTVSGSNHAEYYGWPAGKTCQNRPQQTGRPWQSLSRDVRDGTISCESGCETAWFSNHDGTATGMPVGQVCKWSDPSMCDMYPGTYWNPLVMGCEYPEPEECPAGQTKDATGNCVDNKCPAGMVEGPQGTCINERNECPAGQVKSPTGSCLPGDGQCAQGEARGADGTCKRDTDGDGVPDNEDDDPSNDDDKESFSGGDNCDSPPSCSGSPILCGQARIQWRIECNTRRQVNITGGACGASSVPVCVGKNCNAMEYSQLLQQWRAACALEKLANGQGGDGGSDGQPAWTRVDGMNTNPGVGQGEGDAPQIRNRTFSIDDLDDTGFGGGGGICPGFAFAASGQLAGSLLASVASPPPFWCQFIATVRAVFLLVGAVVAVFIIARN